MPAVPRSAWSFQEQVALPGLHVNTATYHRRCLSMWKAICLTLLASSLNNIGKALQKEATGSLPRYSLSVGTVSQYLRSRTWLIGLAADVGGAVLMLAALALAPVSCYHACMGSFCHSGSNVRVSDHNLAGLPCSTCLRPGHCHLGRFLPLPSQGKCSG